MLITGGAGFVGAHLAERLARDNAVVVADDLSNGRESWIPADVPFSRVDLTDPAGVAEVLTPDVDLVFHLAARKAVDDDQPRTQLEANTAMTYNVLERMCEVGVTELAYTSSSTVYGEAPTPTPEDYAPLEPISVYGASKLADEGVVSVYANSHGIRATIFRFANVVGPRLRGAVIPDFIEKLRETPETLTILGDGRQEKSYLHVEDCLDGICHALVYGDGAASDGTGSVSNGRGGVSTFNLGTRTTTSVTRIADVVSEEMGLDPDYEYTGGDRGWTGDVPRMRLSIEKLSALGWEPDHSSEQAVRRATRELLEEL